MRKFKPVQRKPMSNTARFGKDAVKSNNFGSYSRMSDSLGKYSATCDACGRRCEVPFRPTGAKPVYCSYCFKNKGQEDENAPPEESTRDENGERIFHEIVCDGCGKETQIPFKPIPGKPVFCKECYASTNLESKATIEKLSKEVKELKLAIAKIMKVLKIE